MLAAPRRRPMTTALVLAMAGVLLAGPQPTGAEAPADPAERVATAEAAAARGDAEAVLFALDGLAAFPEGLEDRALAALAAGARAALEAEDPILGLQLCQMALRHDGDHRDALVRCIVAASSLDQYDPAEAWTATLRAAHPTYVAGALLEARLFVAQGEWERARDAARAAERIEGATPVEVARARAYRERAEAEIASRQSALSEIEALSARVEASREALAEAERRPAAARGSATERQVIIYMTSWCGACRRAARWLRNQGVPFVEKDIERDPAALQELAAKAQARGIQPRGVPVIDVAGDLLLGFSEQGLRQALVRRGFLR